MRSSPAYVAVPELNRQAAFRKKYAANKPLTNQAGDSFYTLRLSEDAHTWVLTLGGVFYRANSDRRRVPHVSVYKNFKLSERFGKSVFHLTWYGVAEDAAGIALSDDAGANDNNDAGEQAHKEVVVHVYFSQTGAYLYSNVTVRVNDASAAAVASAATVSADAPIEIALAPQEAALLQRHAVQFASPAIAEILQFVQQQADAAREKVKASLSALEKIRAPQGGQQSRYIDAARECIRDINSLNQWCFERTDSRLSWLRAVVSGLSGLQQSHAAQAAAVASPALFASEGGKDNAASDDELDASATASAAPTVRAHSKPVNRKGQAKAKAVARRRASNEALNRVDAQLLALEADTAIDDVEKALQKLPLLEERVAIIASQGFAGPQEKVQAIFQDLREHHKAIKALFREKAMSGDLPAVEKLTALVSDITDVFFAELVLNGHIRVIEYIIDHFPESIIYVNHYAFEYNESTGADAVNRMPILMCLLDREDRLDIFEMLLRKGADPNVHSVDHMSQGVTVLDQAVFKDLRDHVRALLKHGAEFIMDFHGIAQPVQAELSAGESAGAVAALSRRGRAITSNKGRGQRSRGNHQAPVSIVKRLDLPPPFDCAIRKGRVEIVRVFVAFGVLSLDYRTKDNFDFLGIACCDGTTDPNLEILSELVAGGADVNVFQGSGMPVLLFQLQKNRLAAAGHLLSLGADSNVIMPTGCNIEGMALPNTVFDQAVLRENADFIRIFLENERVPVSVATYVRACGFHFSPDEAPLVITLPTLEINVDLLPSDEIACLLIQYREKFLADPGLHAAVVDALADADRYKHLGKHAIAMRFYMVGFLFGEFEVRRQACIGIAGCCENLGNFPLQEVFQRAAGHYEEIDDPAAASGAMNCVLI